MTNRGFMDKSGFNSHQTRKRAWSRIGEPAIVKVPTQKVVNVSVVGCISPWGTINFSKVEPPKPSDAAEKEFLQPDNKKKRKATTGEASKPKLKKGTTAYRIVKFVEACMDILDKMDKKGVYFVMGNCRIHHSYFVVEAINKRGYKPLFMPPIHHSLIPLKKVGRKSRRTREGIR
jgi:hypothetical protein